MLSVRRFAYFIWLYFFVIFIANEFRARNSAPSFAPLPFTKASCEFTQSLCEGKERLKPPNIMTTFVFPLSPKVMQELVLLKLH
jgi:hypothetical protein